MHSHHLLHLVPRPRRTRNAWSTSSKYLAGKPSARGSSSTPFGNPLIRIELAQPHRELKVVSQMQIEVHARPAVSPETTTPWQRVRDSFAYHGAWPSRDQLEAARFRHESPHVRLKQSFTDYSARCFPEGRPILACAEALSTMLHADIAVHAGRDHHQHFTDRSGGNPARRLPGFRASHDCLPAFARPAGALRERLPAHQSTQAEGDAKLVGDAASHAWVAVWSPPYGWIEFDPTNGCFAGTDHVAVAWGRDFGDVSPLRGVILGGADHKLSVTVLVEPDSISSRSFATSTERT